MNPPSSPLSDRVVIITGASSGIGKALAISLAQRGADLVLAARRAEKLEEVARACETHGVQVLTHATDVSIRQDCESLIEATLARFHRVDILVNNAGIMMWSRFDETSDLSAAESLMQVNYLGSVYCTYAALPALKRARGQIVAVISLAGLTGVPTRSFYAASKHAMAGFFDSIRVELEGDGVSVTNIFPGFVAIEERHRALGPDGKALGSSPVNESRAMTAQQCAERITEAILAREREVIMHPLGRLAQVAKALVPGLVDLLALRTLARYKSK